MNKELAYKLSAFAGCQDLFEPTKPKDPEPQKDESELKSVLDEIFSVDLVSGFPRGDIQYYLSSDGNPLVKQWLETHLLKPRMSVSSNPDGVTDDLINEMSRGVDESIFDYQARLKSIYDTAKADLDSFRQSVVEPAKE